MRAAGALLALGAAACFGVGLALQKRRAVALPRLGEARWRATKAFAGDARWLAATSLVVAGWGLETAALALAPVALVFPVALSGIALVAALSARWFHERLVPSEWAGVALSLAGAAAASLSLGEEALRSGGLSRLALGLAVGILAAAGVASLALGRRGRGAELSLASGAGLLYAASGLLTKALALALAASSPWEVLVIVPPLAAASLLAMGALQAAFQGGRATVAVAWSGTISSFVPAALGSFIFGETWPDGARGAARMAALAAVLAGFLLLLKPATRLQAGAARRPRSS